MTTQAADRRVVVDPRFAERRAQVERDSRRRRRNQLLGGAAVLALAAACIGALRSPLFDVDAIQVVGAEHTPVAEVVAASGIVIGQQLFDVDGGAAARQLEALPWVRRARVARAWPGGVRISVVERTPVAQVAVAGGGWFLADGYGRLVAQVPEPEPGLLVLDGVVPAGAAAGLQLSDWATGAAALVGRFGERVASRALGVRFTGDEAERSVEVLLRPEVAAGDEEGELPPAVVVAFGPVGVEVGAKLDALEAVLGQVDGRCVATIDVVVPADPRVTRLEGCE
ncbi:MAG: FtsQ-type POTRA domain-containing protein [Acidimicrobiia bacterium]|nr:FtsQ-type POTRA domain-containing protein [Acidimicrobiia bacterium]